MTQPLSAEKKASAEYDQLKETISSLPSKVITEASLEAGHEEYVCHFLYCVLNAWLIVLHAMYWHSHLYSANLSARSCTHSTCVFS